MDILYKRLSLLISLVSLLFLIALPSSVKAASYEISRLEVDVAGFSNVEESFRIGVNFRLKSISGFARSRFRLTLAGNDLIPGAFNPESVVDIDLDPNDPEFADIYINICKFRVIWI